MDPLNFLYGALVVGSLVYLAKVADQQPVNQEVLIPIPVKSNQR
jgi:hypothetical protein